MTASGDEGLRELVARALAEDLGGGDVTTAAVVSEEAETRGRVVQKQPGVIFGLEVAGEVFAQAGARAFDPLAAEGEWRDGVPADVALASGTAHALLAAERTALNLVGHLSGIATLTHRFVEAVGDGGVQVLDTRKTTPGLRALEKAAVVAGGGHNHRMGLYDAILIKENHVALAGGIAEAVRLARDSSELAVEVECRDLEEVRAALDARPDRLLLDNMDPDGLRAAVQARDGAGERVELEASGGITLDTAGEIAATGVDYLSIGALTHSAPALDLSMLVEPA